MIFTIVMFVLIVAVAKWANAREARGDRHTRWGIQRQNDVDRIVGQ